MGQAAVARIVKTIAVFDDFCQANDPYEEHDFGAFEAERRTIFLKIDLYEEPGVKSKNGESVVNRVLTIMLQMSTDAKTNRPPAGKSGVATYTLKKTGGGSDHRDHRGLGPKADHTMGPMPPMPMTPRKRTCSRSTKCSDDPDAPYAFGDPVRSKNSSEAPPRSRCLLMVITQESAQSPRYLIAQSRRDLWCRGQAPITRHGHP